MSVMMKDLLTTYKMGWKTSYYQNTYDYKTDPSEIEDDVVESPLVTSNPYLGTEEEECEACAI
jgi:ribonucleoside-diphosphate reductase alpha chain